MPLTDEAKALYRVLEPQAARVADGALMGSDHTYVIPEAGSLPPPPQLGAAAAAARRAGALRKESDVDIALDPEELEGLDQAGIQALYDERRAAQRGEGREVRLRAVVLGSGRGSGQ